MNGFGIDVELPPGWDGRIYRRQGIDVEDRARAALHAANFALPTVRGDFGSGAVETMGPGDVLVTLLDYGPEAAGTPLFRRRGAPEELRPESFSTGMLQRAVAGQAGSQHFFTAAGRGYCLYVVLGSSVRRLRLVPLVNDLLKTLRLSP